MVLDVARALDVVGMGRVALELGEDRLERLAHHVGEHVEPAAVGHADDDLLEAELAAALDDLLERRDRRLGAVEAEPLGAGVFLVEEALEGLRRGQPLQDGAPAVGGEFGAVLDRLDALLDPGFDPRLLYVHELDADVAAIGRPAAVDDLAQGRDLAQAQIVVDEDRAVEVGVGEAVGLVVELGVVLAPLEAERVERGVEMAAHPVGADDHQRADRIERGGADRAGVRHHPHRPFAVRLGAAVAARPPDHRPAVTVADHVGVARLPARTGEVGQRRTRVLAQLAEKGAPGRVDRVRVLQETFVQVREERRIGAVQVSRLAQVHSKSSVSTPGRARAGRPDRVRPS